MLLNNFTLVYLVTARLIDRLLVFMYLLLTDQTTVDKGEA